MAGMGVYAITHSKSGRSYIGQSHHIEQRWHLHRYHLRRGSHHSIALQKDWTREGEDAFVFEVLEVVADRAELRSREQDFLARLRPAYNRSPVELSRMARAARAHQRARTSAVHVHTQGGAVMSARVPLNVRVPPELREMARVCAESRGLSQNEFVIAALQAACQQTSPADLEEVLCPDLPTTSASSEQTSELLRLAELMAADMHLVREVLHAAYPAQEEAARPVVRSWISRLRLGVS